jgi:hypothetical protein
VDVVGVVPDSKTNGRYEHGPIRESCGSKSAWMLMSMVVTLAAARGSALLDA